jgi:putative serine protease PepD
MNSNEYPPPHPDGGASTASGAGRQPGGTEPFSQAYEPVRPAAPSYDTDQHGYYAPPAQPTSSYPPPPAFQPHGPYGYQPVQHTQQLPTQLPPGAEGNSPGDRADKRRRGRVLLITALLAALLGGGVGGGVVALADHNDGNSVNTGLRITNATGAPAAQLDGTVGAAAAKIRPSVVTIAVSGSQEAGTGSGVIIRKDGYILTNDHVVSIGGGAGNIQVSLADGRTVAAKIVGRDTSDDLAVIKIDGVDNLPAATFAKSSSLSVGQTVVAVGAPLGLSDTVTSGIVSNVARPVRAGDNDQAVFEAVQTDAAINPGNSGGPLVDLNGSVVGINAAIASDNSGGGLQIPGQPAQQAGNIGIGFAIPSDEASRIASELIATGKATHAVLGVEVGGNPSNQSPSGVPLRSVTAGGAASKVGLKTGDIITSIDGQRVTTADSLIAAVRNHAPGQRVKITYLRSGKTREAEVTLGSSDS